MSEAIKILEGGVDRSQNQIFKLKTDTVGGGVCYWIPETELATDDKSITANGTYTAEQDGLYGYSELHVSVPASGGVSGKDNPGGGTDWNDYEVDVDEDGYIEETKIPSYIIVTTPPTKLDYYDGDDLDFSGIVVTAYDANGESMGEVPYDELIFPTTNADSSSATYTDEWVVPMLDPPVYLKEYNIGDIYSGEEGDTEYYYIYGGNITGTLYMFQVSYEVSGNTRYTYVWVSLEPFVIYTQRHAPSTWDPHKETVTSQKGEVEGYEAFFAGGTSMYPHPVNTPISADTEGYSAIAQAIIAINNGHKKGGTQAIPVQWARSGDFKLLESNYNIAVQEVESGTAHGGSEG